MSVQIENTTPNLNRASIVERAIAIGDLSELTPEERLEYYNRVCESLGLNPLTRPFEYLRLNGRLVLYARKDATEQLRKLNNVSIEIVSREIVGGEVYVVVARARSGDRADEAIGAVPIAGLRGEAYANAIMKAETKAKRRVTLSICGLGWLDESEIESIPDAKPFVEPAPALNAPKPVEAQAPEAPKPALELKLSARERLIEAGKRGAAALKGDALDDVKATLLNSLLDSARQLLKEKADDETMEEIAKDIEALVESAA